MSLQGSFKCSDWLNMSNVMRQRIPNRRSSMGKWTMSRCFGLQDGTCSAKVCLSELADDMTRLNRILRCNTISFASKFKLCKSLVTSMLFFGCETWTLLADSEEEEEGGGGRGKRIQAFETKCLRKLLRISYLEHKTNDWFRSKINFLVVPQEPLLATVRRRKLVRACQTPW